MAERAATGLYAGVGEGALVGSCFLHLTSIALLFSFMRFSPSALALSVEVGENFSISARGAFYALVFSK